MWLRKIFTPLALPIHFFAAAIFLGAGLLCQPIRCAGETVSFLDALFTATSAACVTGLAVVDTGSAKITRDELLGGRYGELSLLDKNMAHQLASPGLIEYLPMDKDVALQEIGIDDWAGRSLHQLDLTNKHQVQVIARKRAGEDHYSFIPRADEELRQGDKLVIVGREDRLTRLRP